jgi:hypothetical protein
MQLTVTCSSAASSAYAHYFDLFVIKVDESSRIRIKFITLLVVFKDVNRNFSQFISHMAEGGENGSTLRKRDAEASS